MGIAPGGLAASALGAAVRRPSERAASEPVTCHGHAGDSKPGFLGGAEAPSSGRPRVEHRSLWSPPRPGHLLDLSHSGTQDVIQLLVN